MPLTAGIENLQRLVERVRREGLAAAKELVQPMRELEREAQDTALDDLARLCRAGAETIEGLDLDPVRHGVHTEAVLDLLTQLLEFAAACELGAAGTGPEADLAAPSAAPLPGARSDDAKHFDETVGMFVTHAIGVVADLENEVLSVEAGGEAADTIEGIRRVVHALEAEFGVLNMLSPQRLCHQAEATIDACVDHEQAFPTEVLLQCVDLLKGHLERLTTDAHAAFPDTASMIDRLRCIAEVASARAADGRHDERSGGSPVRLAAVGEFASSLPEFLAEARVHLAEIEAAMVALAGDAGDVERISQSFRSFHTIKGVAGFLNLTPIVELAHTAETLFDAVRSGHVVLGTAQVDLVLATCDLGQRLLQALEGQPAPLQRELRHLLQRLQTAAEGPLEVDVPNVNAPAEAPPADQPAPAAGPVPDAAAAAPAASPEPLPGETAPFAETGPAEAVPAEAVPAAAPVPQPAPATDAAAAPPALGVDRSHRVSTTRLDSLVDMVGELAIAQSMVLHDPALRASEGEALARHLAQVGKITRDLQEGAMALRMVTLKATFQKMARLVRDVAAKTGKRVVLTVAGEDSEVDRNVVEKIADPLVHLVRNAIDHGLEPNAERMRLGKPPEGRLALRAYQRGGSLVVEIEDDGRGVDKANVVRKAIAQGLLPPGASAADMSDAEVFELLFRPGFTTAEQVTELSGRGVGMDVVRREIDGLRGSIEVESRIGTGTAIRLRVPLTLAIIDGMVVGSGDDRYIVPTLCVERCFRPAAADLHCLADRGECVCVRDEVLPIHRLDRLLGHGHAAEELTAGILMVVDLGGERCCLFVDRTLGQQQVVVKPLGLPNGRVHGVSGGAIMSDGRIALILDVAALLERQRLAEGDGA